MNKDNTVFVRKQASDELCARSGDTVQQWSHRGHHQSQGKSDIAGRRHRGDRPEQVPSRSQKEGDHHLDRGDRDRQRQDQCLQHRDRPDQRSTLILFMGHQRSTSPDRFQRLVKTIHLTRFHHRVCLSMAEWTMFRLTSSGDHIIDSSFCSKKSTPRLMSVEIRATGQDDLP